jgi:hypothetical protein
MINVTGSDDVSGKDGEDILVPPHHLVAGLDRACEKVPSSARRPLGPGGSPMNVELLVHALVRQTTILIAQLATSQGIRAPLAHIADQVFNDLVGELDRQGVSRKVSADMFGMGLRTYRRKVQRLRESSTERGRSLWETVLAFIRERGRANRSEIVMRFSNDDEAQLKAVLHDLCESGIIVASGSGPLTTYRASVAEETGALVKPMDPATADDLLVALMYREGPLTLKQIAAMAQDKASKVEKRLTRLVDEGRIRRMEEGSEPRFKAEALVIPLGADAGWEGAVFDHYKALVATVLSRLRNGGQAKSSDCVGGSTYTIEVWDGHPMEQEILDTLRRLRVELSEARSRVVAFDPPNGERPSRKRVTIYVGQYVVEEEDENEDSAP